ncbi:MAG TPA: NapC/NirT family cytochrome c, partial [Longimicrobiales bacterium]|nr:NapC/NirT family cytochrome c [Longimicrobiales bacterium]
MALKRLRALPGRIRHLPARWVVPLLIVVVGGIVTGSIFMYRTYNYVQHDNDFCLSCHLMREPYERFAQSAHRGLGCKACHQPTPIARAQMGLAQIVEQPESLTVHAEVPNERCIDCHVKGNPAEWRLISNSAGHRIHLESQDRRLRDLTCVQCHSTSVHEFAATSRTCAQSGCHETTDIQLGKMGELTMHCIACHDFSRPVRTNVPADSLRVVLQPQREQCLSCHQMRALVADMPADDPHAGACGACHDPHEQRTPAEA